MTRILLFVLFIVAAALGLAWLADRPGTVTVQWLGYQIETSAFVATLVMFALVLLVILVIALLRYVWTRPAAVAAYMHERRQQQGLEALSRGLLAIGVGDRAQAQRYAGIAGRYLPREPLTALLRAQAAQLKGDPASARRAFEAMLDRPETQPLGVRGLFLEAKRGNDEDAARALAEQAVRQDPKLAWGVNALFDIQARAGDWNGALNTLAIARQNGHVDTDTANRRRAVLLTSEARETETFDPDKALTLANEALRLAPSLVPAAELAGRLFASKGEARAASRQIVRTWKQSPHPDLAVAYAFAKPGLSPKDRLKRVEYLAGLTPDDVEGPIAVAQAAIDAKEWQQARDVLAPYVEGRPSARICTLMARIEGGSGDKGREREWLARAVRAPRDRAWIAGRSQSRDAALWRCHHRQPRRRPDGGDRFLGLRPMAADAGRDGHGRRDHSRRRVRDERQSLPPVAACARTRARARLSARHDAGVGDERLGARRAERLRPRGEPHRVSAATGQPVARHRPGHAHAQPDRPSGVESADSLTATGRIGGSRRC
jgi:HemY protein